MNFRFGFFECVSPGICEAARSNPQVRNSYRVGRRVYAPKIPVFVSVNKFRTPLGVFRPVAIKYRTPLRISGTCFPPVGEWHFWEALITTGVKVQQSLSVNKLI